MKKFNFKDKDINISYAFIAYIVFAIVFMIIMAFLDSRNVYEADDLFNPNSHNLIDYITDEINNQNTISNIISDALKNKEYTIDDPYILKNPYEINPLSALVIFYTNESVKVGVEINDDYIGETDSTNNHIIPLYGLHEGTYNYVTLNLSNGITKTIVVKTQSEDFNLYEDIKINNKKNVFFNSYSNDSMSFIRAFDYMTNLKLNIKGVNFVKSYNIIDNKIIVEYSGNKNMKGIYLTMDFLGHILNVSDTYEGYIENNNFEFSLYNNGINNYEITKYSSNKEETEYKVLSFDEVASDLMHAKYYNKDYNIYYANGSIYYDFNEKGIIIIVRDDGKVFSYNIDSNGCININNKHSYSLYLNVDSTYYNLNTVF